MKRIVLQLLRTGVTLVIMATMAAMIFSLRDDRERLSATARDAVTRAAALERQLQDAKADPDSGVYVLCRFDLKPDADIGDYVAKTLTVVPTVRAEEGCRMYALLKDAETDWTAPMRFGERTMWMVEKWDSIDALKAHLAAPHMKAFGPTVQDLRTGSTFHVLQPLK